MPNQGLCQLPDNGKTRQLGGVRQLVPPDSFRAGPMSATEALGQFPTSRALSSAREIGGIWCNGSAVRIAAHAFAKLGIKGTLATY